MKTLSKALLSFTSTSKEADIIEARLSKTSNNSVARALDIPRRTVDRTVKRVIQRAEEAGVTPEIGRAKVLILDIETAPMLSYLWSLWPRGGINADMQESASYVLSWAAKWLGDDEVMADAICYNRGYSVGDEDDRRMLRGIWKLLDEADFVVAHNGDKFDIKRLNTAFLLAGLGPPRPYKQIDTLKMVKRAFAFDSNRLNYLLGALFGTSKAETGGFETWRQCILGNMEAWDTLIAYNKQDVTELERLYLEIRAWDKSHPSLSVMDPGAGGSIPACTTCSSENISPTGAYVYTNASRFEGYVCEDCGSQMRGRESKLSLAEKASLLVKAR